MLIIKIITIKASRIKISYRRNRKKLKKREGRWDKDENKIKTIKVRKNFRDTIIHDYYFLKIRSPRINYM